MICFSEWKHLRTERERARKQEGRTESEGKRSLIVIFVSDMFFFSTAVLKELLSKAAKSG